MDSILLKKIDSFKDKESPGDHCLSIFSIWVEIISIHTKLSKSHAKSIVKERGLQSISAFIDLHFRFKKTIFLSKKTKIFNVEDELIYAFKHKFQDKDLSYSRVLRHFILKMIFRSYHREYKNLKLVQEPEKISLKHLA